MSISQQQQAVHILQTGQTAAEEIVDPYSGTLYGWLFRGTTKYEYDSRIDEYNWYLIFAVEIAFYCVLHQLVRKYAPPPKLSKEEYIMKKNVKEYYAYYFQYTSLFHALVSIVFDLTALLTCGYRYNQENHLFYMIMMVHSTAYFVYDSVAEVLAGCDDFLMNLHHVCVVSVSLWHLSSRNSGFEFLVLHWMAETSNPFLIFRAILKMRGLKSTKLYKQNDVVFAIVFLTMRLFLTPLALIYIYEADQVIYGTKFGVAFVLLVQLIWIYRVLQLVGEAVLEVFPKSTMVSGFTRVTKLMSSDPTVKKYLMVLNFFLIFVCTHFYYGFVRKSLFNFL